MSDAVSDAMAEDAQNVPVHSLVPTVRRRRGGQLTAGLSLVSQRYLLLLRFAVVNAAGFTLLAAAWAEGLIDPIIATDSTHLCLLIFLVFLAGLGLSAQRILRTSRELNRAKEFDPSVPSRAARYLAEVRGRDSGARSIAASSLKFKLSARIGTVRQISSTLVILGLIGTVIGFIMALSGVDPEKAGDVAAIGPMVSKLIEGMAVALYTTLIGGVLNIWLNINIGLLSGATVNLITEIVAVGERHAGP
ncbi:MotA/TolQ/ExbB proton channel family protein [Azospirillum argentinense]